MAEDEESCVDVWYSTALSSVMVCCMMYFVSFSVYVLFWRVCDFVCTVVNLPFGEPFELISPVEVARERSS